MRSRLQVCPQPQSGEAASGERLPAYQVKTSIDVIAGNTLWSMPERLNWEWGTIALYKYTYLYLPEQNERKFRYGKMDLRTVFTELGCG